MTPHVAGADENDQRTSTAAIRPESRLISAAGAPLMNACKPHRWICTYLPLRTPGVG